MKFRRETNGFKQTGAQFFFQVAVANEPAVIRKPFGGIFITILIQDESIKNASIACANALTHIELYPMACGRDYINKTDEDTGFC